MKTTLISTLTCLSLMLTAPLSLAEMAPAAAPTSTEPVELNIVASDGLPLTASLHAPHESEATPFILLLHQAGWSRGEYLEIAPKLNAMGFNVMALDQRSGGEVNGVLNESHAEAEARGKKTSYVHAYPDIEAAVAHVRKHLASRRLILWGSSYSAALALRFAGENPKTLDGVMAFAPGEYFERLGKPADWITRSASRIKAPAFITSARKERDAWWAIYEAIPGEKSHFLPKTVGNHGSRALWERFDDHEAYWRAVEGFLAPYLEEARQTLD